MQRSRVNKSYQHSQRNKTQDSEYVRYRADCSGVPFPNNREATLAFENAIVDIYKRCNKTVSQILEDWLEPFSSEVARAIAWRDCVRLTFKTQTASESPFSFGDHVAKRLVLLRKAGKLVRKRPIFQKPRTGARKKKVEGVISGTQIKKVE